jgi:phenylpropionate dioxygenase-like ring-hydroxylating dioxygenase large terminal subunit
LSPFVLNAWYAAAWADEVGRSLLARRILDVPVVLWRTLDGEAVALHDRCPHRSAHLSAGKLVGDEVECAYHGLRFDAGGACTLSPFADRPPPNATARKLPLVERHATLWIWMGDEAAADPALIPHHPHLADAAYGQVKGHDKFAANYMLGVDNLMELTHLFWLHPSTIGGDRQPGPAPGETYDVRQEGERRIVTTTFTPNNPRAKSISDGVGDEAEAIDRWNDTTWDLPSNMRFDIGSVAAGGGRDVPPYMVQSHFLTPETATSGHYFWAASRTFDLGAEADARYTQFFGDIFRGEDRPMLEAIQRQMGEADFWALKPVILPRDGGAVLARRLVERQLAREAKTAMAAE